METPTRPPHESTRPPLRLLRDFLTVPAVTGRRDRINRVLSAAEAVQQYRAGHGEGWDPDGWVLFTAYVRERLAGRDLACWCPLTGQDGQPVPCHADVLLELANPPAAPVGQALLGGVS